MSEYQYYEFQAVDRPLSEQEQAELRKLSTRAEIDSWNFSNEYSYGDFRGNVDKVLEQYFDAHLYVANWGTNRLMFRLPRSAVDPDAFEPYMDQEKAVMRLTPKYVILGFTSNLEGGEGWIDGEGMLAPLLPLRDQLLAGDLRCLYIAWLSAMTDDFTSVDEEEEESILEPPVPPGLKSLDKPLKQFVKFMRVESKLLATAARNSDVLTGAEVGEKTLAPWLAGKPVEQKDAWLVQLLLDEGAGARRQILSEWRREQKPQGGQTKERRTLAELLGREKEAEEEESDATSAGLEQPEFGLPDSGAEEEKWWQEAEQQIEIKKAAGYKQAVQILTDLRDRAERQVQGTVFATRLGKLVEKHQSKKAFVDQLRKAGLVE
jgi:hypothetical protein